MKARNDARDEAQRNKPSGFTPAKNIVFGILQQLHLEDNTTYLMM